MTTEYLTPTINDLDEIEALYRKYLDNGALVRARLEHVLRDSATLSVKAVDGGSGKTAGVVIYTPGISFSCVHPRIYKAVAKLTEGAFVYTGEAVFVENEYRGLNIARDIEKICFDRLSEIAAKRGTELYVLHEMWVYPDGSTPALGIVSEVFGICVDLGTVPHFYKDYFKNGSLCPVCGKQCVCSARITLSKIQ